MVIEVWGAVGPQLLVGGPSGLLDFVLVLEGEGSDSVAGRRSGFFVTVHDGVQELLILVAGLKATRALNSMYQ